MSSLAIGIAIFAACAAAVLVLKMKFHKEDEPTTPSITEQEVHAELNGHVESPVVEEPTLIINPNQLPVTAVEKKKPVAKKMAAKKTSTKKKKADA